MTAEARSSSRLLAYLQLFRLPNVFTAMADIAMGFFVTHAVVSGGDWIVLALLLAASSCLYTAGMVLNDVYDLKIDTQERPTRPLPSQRIDATFAKRLGMALLAVGLLFAISAALINEEKTGAVVRARAVICGVGLAGLILLYNRILKHTAIGPAAMGGCRALNVLLGMSASPAFWMPAHFTIAGGIGIYISGVTWFARTEATTSKRGQLIGALVVVLLGLGIMWQWPTWAASSELPAMKIPEQWRTVLWIIIGAVLVWRFLRAIAAPNSGNVQAAVKAGILGIIAIDAVTAFIVSGPVAAIAIFLLIFPTLALGAWIYST